MSSIGPTGDSAPRDSGAGHSQPVNDSDGFYDRERWHDVEHEESGANEEDSFSEKQTRWTSLSVAILLIVTIIAGGSGVVAAHMLHRHSVWLSEPIPHLRDYRSTPAQWIGYAPNALFYCEVDKPISFAATMTGELFIGDESQNRVHCYSERGALLRTLTLPAVPLALAFGNDDRIFADQLVVAHPDRLAVYSKEGEEQRSWKWPEPDSKINCLVLTDQAVFASDSVKCVIYRFNEEGKLLGSFGKRKTQSNSKPATSAEKTEKEQSKFGGFVVFRSPITMTFSPKNGLLYVSNPGYHRIEVFTTEGYWEPSLCWESASGDLIGFCGCCNPIRLACLDDGRLVTGEKEINRVKIYHSNGKLDCVVVGPETLDTKPPNVPQLDSFPPAMLGGEKEVFIAAIHDNYVVVFDPVMRLARYFIPIQLEKAKPAE